MPHVCGGERFVQWAVGLVISTGHDTKVMMSIAKAPEKTSHLNTRVNTVGAQLLRSDLPRRGVDQRGPGCQF